MRTGTLLVLAALAIVAVACGDDAASPPVQVTPVPTDEITEVDMVTIEGTLGGDAELEGGCAWVDADQRYEVLWPQGYAVRFDPVRLTDAEGEVLAEAGEVVRVSGREAEDMVSVCQIGPLLEAVEVEVP